MANVQKIKQALVDRLNKGLERNIYGEPTLKLKNGVRLVIEDSVERGRYNVDKDFGCTCTQLGYAVTLDELVQIILKQSK